jgi:hypothetical protein
MVFRSPPSIRDGCDPDLSFGSWSVTDDLPFHDDDVTSFAVDQSYDDLLEDPVAVEGVPVEAPHHPSFPPSGVVVPIRSRPTSLPQITNQGKAASTHASGTHEERETTRAVVREYPDFPVVELPDSTASENLTGPGSPLSNVGLWMNHMQQYLFQLYRLLTSPAGSTALDL